jgi:hypothetical protein
MSDAPSSSVVSAATSPKASQNPGEQKEEERKERKRKEKAYRDKVKAFERERYPASRYRRAPWSTVEEYTVSFMATHNIFAYLDETLFAGECFPDPSPRAFPALLTSFAGFWQDPKKPNVITFSVLFECLKQVLYGVEKLCKADSMGVTTEATRLYTHLDEEPVPRDTH